MAGTASEHSQNQIYGLIVLAGVFAAIALIQCRRIYLFNVRQKQISDEEETEEATATITDKFEDEVVGSSSQRQVFHRVNFEFIAERADGTPCKVQVTDRSIDLAYWGKLEEGQEVQVVYLTGRPAWFEIKDLVDPPDDLCASGDRCRSCLFLFFLLPFVALFLALFLAPFVLAGLMVADSDDPGMTVVAFALSMCGSFAVCSRFYVYTCNQDTPSSGKVDVQDLSDSD